VEAGAPGSETMRAWREALNLPNGCPACHKCGCQRDVQLPHEDGTFMTVDRYMALHNVPGMVLLCEQRAPVGSRRLGK
jgi:hypothetical protein